MKYKTESVFGVSNDEVLSYIERDKVDGLFISGLKTKKHIIVFGSSKQGKTALVLKHIPKDSFVRINCSPESKAIDIYSSLLRQIGVTFEEKKTVEDSTSANISGKVSASVKIPIIANGAVDLGSSLNSTDRTSITYKVVDYNLALPQDIAEIIREVNYTGRVVLDNFHYLSDEVQQRLAFDLRVFEDYNLLFIILGIWREKNRLAQYNGDLQDRIIEIPVEPWEPEDFRKVCVKGSDLLNVDFSSILDSFIQNSFDSIGVFQELLKHSCLAQDVTETCDSQKIIDEESFATAVQKKLDDYSGRHIRSIEAFIEQKVKMVEEVPLYMHYYFIKIILTEDFTTIQNGLKRKYIQEKIKEMHHRAEDVRHSDISYFLHNITASQTKRNIIPPLFDYDRSIKMLKIIDSTLYFFLRNANCNEILEDLTPPVGVEN